MNFRFAGERKGLPLFLLLAFVKDPGLLAVLGFRDGKNKQDSVYVVEVVAAEEPIVKA